MYKLLNNPLCTLQFPIQQKHHQFLSRDLESDHLYLTVTRTAYGSVLVHICSMQIRWKAAQRSIYMQCGHRPAVKAPWSFLEQGQTKHLQPPNPHKSSGFRGICSCKYNPFPLTKHHHMDCRPTPDPNQRSELRARPSNGRRCLFCCFKGLKRHLTSVQLLTMPNQSLSYRFS